MARLNRTIALATIALWAVSAAAGEGGQAETAPNPPASAPAPAVSPPTQNGSAPADPKPVPQAAPQTTLSPPAASKGTPALVLDTEDYEGILGKSVRAANGEDLGRIIDVILDKEGRTRAAIIDFGGFLGVGSRKIAVDWRVLKFTDGKSGALTLALSRNQVRVSPEYKSGEPIVVLGATSPSGPAPEGEAPPAPPAAPQDKQAQQKTTTDKPLEKASPEPSADKPQEQTPDR